MPNDEARPDDGSESADAPVTWFDGATGLPGRAFWQAVLSAESARCARFQRPATIVLAQAVGFADVVRMWGVDAAERSIADVGVKLLVWLSCQRLRRATRRGPARPDPDRDG